MPAQLLQVHNSSNNGWARSHELSVLTSLYKDANLCKEKGSSSHVTYWKSPTVLLSISFQGFLPWSAMTCSLSDSLHRKNSFLSALLPCHPQ